MLPLITSRQHPRVAAARQLNERKHRRQQGRFLVEGSKLLQMALAAGVAPEVVFICPERLSPAAAALASQLEAAGAELAPVSAAVMQTLAEREDGDEPVAVMMLPPTPLDALSLPVDGLALVLDRLQDPGNVGTLLRTADAAGASAVILLEPCVDPFDPKVVRGSMGSLFTLPLARVQSAGELARWLHGHGARLVGADAQRGELWGEGLWSGPVALALGNEARGLSPDLAAEVDAWARLPIPGKAESLNVAVAGGILLYTWLRTRAGHFSNPSQAHVSS